MDKQRFFVTYALILGTVFTLAITATRDGNQNESAQLVLEANAKISELKNMDSTLDQRADWNLSLHTRQERRQWQRDLAHYLSALNRVLEIGSMRHLFIEDRELLLERRDRAEANQKTIEQFENKYGTSFEPKRLVMNSRPRKIL